MKTFIKITALFCIITLLAGCGLVGESDKATEKKEVENAVVTVNGDHLSRARFNYYFYDVQDEMLKSSGIENSNDIPEGFWQQKTDGKTNLDIVKEKALAAMIDDYLKYQKAVEEDISLTADELASISSYVGELKQNEQGAMLLDMLQMDGDTLEQIFVEQECTRKLINKYVDDKKIEVDEKQVISDLEANYVKAQHVLIMTTDSVGGAPLSEDKIAEKKALAEDVLKRARGGEDFNELMELYGEDPGAKATPEGYVFATGEMVPEFEEAAFALGINEISGIVETDYGYHIIKRVPMNPEGAKENEIMTQYRYNQAVPKMDDFVKEWKAEAKIEKNEKVYNAIEPIIAN